MHYSLVSVALHNELKNKLSVGNARRAMLQEGLSGQKELSYGSW